MPAELRREVVERVRAGARWREVQIEFGISHQLVSRVLREAGGMPAQWDRRGRRTLSFAEREEISRGLAAGEPLAVIARRVERPTSTISREVQRNGGRDRYRAATADRTACQRARRPKPGKLATVPALRVFVRNGLSQRWSPEQISAKLVVEFPDDEEMRVSPETIYQALYVQGRGELRRELTRCLRSGRTRRLSRGQRNTRTDRGRIVDMVMITDRPAEIEDRAVPGHWEGDLIVGRSGRSQIGTLVERTTRFVMLVALPESRDAVTVARALQDQVGRLPEQLRRSLTWDQGKELAGHAQFTLATGIPVYFCEPHSPWQRGSNENTNGLLRQYFPKGTDLSVHTQADLDTVAAELNNRPRKTLDWMTPLEAFNQLALQ
jgi:transposase, IS30 family